MDDFRKEVHALSTKDLILIIEDQKDLYSAEEFAILQEELSSRPENALELEENAEEEQRIAREKEVERKRIEEKNAKQKAILQNRIELLRKKGYEGYYEYKTLSFSDNDSGELSTQFVTIQLNDLALDGWRLVSAYSNELGHNSHSSGFGGLSTGTNATIDQHILIFERFIKI
ncbi:MAG: DUF4177 domain-containing protein [Oscillospiraceae bacterium]|nr:DUF4177 domain-containing protein [Oscillospiraceae bacterium]